MLFDMTLDIIEAVAEEALAHKQTVERRMLGLRVRGRVGQRIDAALAKRGIKPGAVVPNAAEPPPAA